MPNLLKQPMLHNEQAVREAWADERAAARQARTSGDTTAEWRHLERAHILSQPHAIVHTRTHLAMLGYGLRNRDRREVTGQVVRLLVAGPGSALHRYPMGNTGGANVSAVTSMLIPADLQAVLTDTRSRGE